MMWHSKFFCHRKFEARWQTLVCTFRELYGTSIPEGFQHWTMCGPHAKYGALHPMSELGQLASAGFVRPDQFVGVDIDPKIIRENKALNVPGAMWIESDFFKAMRAAYRDGWFQPALINADLLSLKEKGVVVVSEIMAFLEYIGYGDVMLVANIMMTNPHACGGVRLDDVQVSNESVIETFERCPSFQTAWAGGKWHEYEEHYLYVGSGDNSRTIMGTMIFYRKQRQCR